MYYYTNDPITHQSKKYHLNSQGYYELYNDPYGQNFHDEYWLQGNQNEINYVDVNQIPNSGAYPPNYHYLHGSSTTHPAYNKQVQQNPYINQQKYAEVKEINQAGIQRKYPTQIGKNNNKQPIYDIPGHRTDIQHKNQIPPNHPDYYQNIKNAPVPNTN